MVADSVRFLKSRGRRVFFDAEHFFDGYRDNPEFSMRVLQGAAEAGADCLVLVDTNGGSLPDQLGSGKTPLERMQSSVEFGKCPQTKVAMATFQCQPTNLLSI